MPVDVALLLELIQQYNFIYNKKSLGFKDVVKKNNAWSSIAETLSCTTDEAKTRLRTLRERFSKELRNHEEFTKSGKVFEDTSLNWEWFEAMQFLGEYVKPRKTCSSTLHQNTASELSSTQSEYTQEESSHSSEETQAFLHIDVGESDETSLLSPPIKTASTSTSTSNSVKTPSRKRQKLSEVSTDIDVELLKTLKMMENSCKEDEDDIFCKALACELRQIEDPKEKQRRKAKTYLIATGLEPLM